MNACLSARVALPAVRIHAGGWLDVLAKQVGSVRAAKEPSDAV
jgi:hypothetical protein